MTDQRRRHAEELFQQAVDLPPDRRGVYLAEQCSDDPDILADVQSLLEHFDAEPTPSLCCDETPFDPEAGLVGKYIGPYKLLQLVGEGGFGSVYLAEQAEPVRRQVALKLIKLGMDTRQVIARFEAEQQALAMMDHPNIAKVLDAGTTESGRPFFVMELVRGIRITDYCDHNNLTTRQRLDLFMQVCRAVQHAHQKGIIHRDLKPSNVLVTLHDGEAIPKVIDFGIAKAIDHRLTDKTLFTEFLRFLGTPEYMSPEQAAMSGLDVDTRTDVYSLGVLLYELLTGTTPFTLKELNLAAYDEIQRIIREQDPPTPSKRLSTLGAELGTVARNRHADPQALTRLLQGDLDWIVMKALEKDRTRRYDTAADLAADVQRHINHEPLLAGPPGRIYRLSKFARRNRVAVVAGALMTAAVLVGFALATVGFLQARKGRAIAEEARARAEAEAARSLAVSNFLQDMLTLADPMELRLLSAFAPEREIVSLTGGGVARDMSVAEMTRRAAGQIDRVFAGKPELEAVARETIGMAMYGLGKYAEAEPQLEEALDIRRRKLGDDHPDTLRSSLALGNLFLDTGRTAEGEPLVRAAYRGMKREYGDRHPRTLSCASVWASALCDRGKLSESDALFGATLDAQKGILGDEHRDTLITMWRWAVAYLSRGRLAEGQQLAGDLYEVCRRTLSPDDSLNVITQPLIGWWYAGRLQYDEAEAILRPALEQCRRVLGEDHPYTFMTMYGLARALQGVEQQQEKRQLYEQALEGFRATRGRYHWQTISTTWSYALACQNWGQYEHVECLYRELLADCVRALGEEHGYTLSVMNDMAVFFERAGKFDEAVRVYRRRLEVVQRLVHPALRGSVHEIWALAEALARMGRLTEAREFAREAIEMTRQAAESQAPTRRLEQDYDFEKMLRLAEKAAQESGRAIPTVVDTAWMGQPSGDVSPSVWNNYAYLLMTCAVSDLRDYTMALPPAQKAAVLSEGRSPEILDTLALAYHLSGDTDKALALQTRTMKLLCSKTATEPTYGAHLVQFLLAKNDEAKARKAVEDVVKSFRSVLQDDNPTAGVMLYRAGEQCNEWGVFLLAEALLSEALEVSRARLGAEHEEVASVQASLSAVYWHQNRYEDAVQTSRQALTMRRNLLGDDNVVVARTWYLLGVAHAAAGALQEAREALEQSLATYGRLGIEGVPAALGTKIELADVLVQLGALAPADALAKEALQRARKTYGRDHLQSIKAKYVSGSVLIARGEPELAMPLLRDGIDACGRLCLHDKDKWMLGLLESALGHCLSTLRRYEEAEPLLLRGYKGLRHSRGWRFTATRAAADRLAVLYEAWGKPEMAARWRHVLDAESGVVLEERSDANSSELGFGAQAKRGAESTE